MLKSDLPEVELTSNGLVAAAQNLTMLNLKAVLDSMGVTLRFNMMTNSAVYEGDGVGQDDLSQDFTRHLIIDTLTVLGIKSHSRVDEMLQMFARENRFHPMREWLESLPQDDVDHIGELASTITTDNPLWETYLRKWMIQTVEAVCGYDRDRKKSIPHVLVLVGGQGIGKSHWLKTLGSGWLKDEAELHLSSPNGKDHQIEVLKHPMAELSELDGIFRKADVSHLKSFISRAVDSIRAPYARHVLVQPRMTSFCGSVNAADFLTDATGSRRFWPITAESIAWDAEVSIERAWGQAYEAWSAGESFELTREEDALRVVQARQEYNADTPERELIAPYFSAHAHLEDKFVPMNRTEILRMLGVRNPSPRAAAQAGAVLNELLGRHRTLKMPGAPGAVKKRAWMFPYSDYAQDQRFWPKDNSLTVIEGGKKEDEEGKD